MSKKNVVFIVSLDEKQKPGRSNPYKYGIDSWKKWCKDKGYEVFVLTDRVYEEEYMSANWHKTYALTLLENSKIDYNQVLIVDADIVVHPDCPDFFEETDGKFAAVMNDGDYEWVNRGIKKYGKLLFNDITIKNWEYFNSGFIIVNKSHLKFFEKIHKFYNENIEKFKYAQENFKVGNDQTPLNFFTRLYDVDVKLLPNCYNLQNMFQKSLLHYPNHSWFTDELHFLDSAWVYHFNGVPSSPERDVHYWMERTYKELYEK
tara:strand:- start:644 stop:1423 length:780 start_codon:yes stop_codon:yes gene_type:complete